MERDKQQKMSMPGNCRRRRKRSNRVHGMTECNSKIDPEKSLLITTLPICDANKRKIFRRRVAETFRAAETHAHKDLMQFSGVVVITTAG